jgi:transposase
MSAKRIRRRFTAQFKAEVALAALQERQTLAALAVQYQLAPAQIATWKQQLQQQAAQVFAPELGVGAAAGGLDAAEVEALYAQLGRLQMENTLLKKRCRDECTHLTGPGAGGGSRHHCPALCGPGAGAQQLLLPAARRDGAESGSDAPA